MTTIWQADPIWLNVTDTLAIYERQRAEQGGGTGVRDTAMLEAAARPIEGITAPTT